VCKGPKDTNFGSKDKRRIQEAEKFGECADKEPRDWSLTGVLKIEKMRVLKLNDRT